MGTQPATKPSDPDAVNQYMKGLKHPYLVIFNRFRKDCIRLVFWGGAKVKDTSGLLEGDYADGRRLATFRDMKQVRSNRKLLRQVVKRQLSLLDG